MKENFRIKEKFILPIQNFIKLESLSGILIFSATILALIFSNSPLFNNYENILSYKIGIKAQNFELIKPVILWINDGLMAIFFFLIGLEIKREILIGELSTFKKASLPIFAAIGGMIIPVIVFFLLNTNPETQQGWGISMATDIAFTLAILKLLGKKVPVGIKIFLTAFAIIDDLGAVLVIAIFYTQNIAWILLLYASILLIILYLFAYLKIFSKILHLIFGIAIWLLFLKSGVHPTIAGVLLAFAIPIRQKINEIDFSKKIKELAERISDLSETKKLTILSKEQIHAIDNLESLTIKVQSPLQQLEHRLHSWVAYLIMPIFALANAGVNLTNNLSIDFSLVTTITLSLFLGKTIGVYLFSYISLKLKFAELPQNTNLTLLFGIAILSGVGFTMSLFISGLAFDGNVIYSNSAKLGIITGSIISGILGAYFIKKGINNTLKNN